MHQCFGAMDARVHALNTCVIQAQNHYMKQMMRVMEETKRTVQSRVVHTRVDNDSAVVQPQAIAESRHAQEGCDLRSGVESGVFGCPADVGASSQVAGAVGPDVEGCEIRGIEYRVYISDRTVQDIRDEFKRGLNGGPSLNDLNRKLDSSWRD